MQHLCFIDFSHIKKRNKNQKHLNDRKKVYPKNINLTAQLTKKKQTCDIEPLYCFSTSREILSGSFSYFGGATTGGSDQASETTTVVYEACPANTYMSNAVTSLPWVKAVNLGLEGLIIYILIYICIV